MDLLCYEGNAKFKHLKSAILWKKRGFFGDLWVITYDKIHYIYSFKWQIISL